MTPDESCASPRSQDLPAGAKEGFPKTYRVIKTGEFRKIYKSGSSFKSGEFVLKVLRTSPSLNSRIGFSISSKSVKRAFRRNRIRRLFKEAYRKNKKGLKKGFDMALSVRKDPGVKFSYKNAESIFMNLTQKAGIVL